MFFFLLLSTFLHESQLKKNRFFDISAQAFFPNIFIFNCTFIGQF
jgi:hypothetical protein